MALKKMGTFLFIFFIFGSSGFHEKNK